MTAGGGVNSSKWKDCCKIAYHNIHSTEEREVLPTFVKPTKSAVYILSSPAALLGQLALEAGIAVLERFLLFCGVLIAF